jgi:hypothetical protein
MRPGASRNEPRGPALETEAGTGRLGMKIAIVIYLIGVFIVLFARSYTPWPGDNKSFAFSVVAWPLLTLVICAMALKRLVK